MGLMELLQPKIDAFKESRSVLDEFKSADLNATTQEDWARIAAARDAARPLAIKSQQVGYKDGLPVYTDDGLGNGGAFGWHYEVNPNGELTKRYDEPSSSNNFINSLATVGLSDLGRGDSWLSGAHEGAANVFGEKAGGPISQWLIPGGNTFTKGQDALESGNGWDILDVAMDSPQFGSMDYITKHDVEPTVPESVKPYATTAGATIGSIWGPIGAAAGYGIGSKIRGDETKSGMIGSGVAIGSAYGGQALGAAVGGATGSQLAGAVAGGATRGALSATPQAIQEGSLKPVGIGAVAGGAMAGLGNIASELTGLDKFGEGLGKASSTAYDGGVDYVPVGAGSFADSTENPTTLNQLMTELETPSGGGMSLANDPIPTEAVNPTGTPEFSATALPDTDTSSMNITDALKYAEPAYKTATKAYSLYNTYQNAAHPQTIQQAPQTIAQQMPQTVQTPITAPVGAGYTLGNMPIGEDERRAWGRVLV